MQFAQPQFLYLGLILIPAVGLFLLWAKRQQRKALDRLGNKNLIQRLSANINWTGRRWRVALWLVALTMVMFALARPQWGSEVREVEQEGLQVMVALDVSQSMLAEDIKPSRLDRAKLEIADLTERLDGDEIGLVLFSGASFVQVPLTSDYLTALNYLDSANPSVISRPGTVIGDAIRTAMSAFDQELNNQKVLIVMTDGEDHETDPLAMAQEAADAGILIYTIGFGTAEGEPVPETDPYGEVVGYKRDQNGEVVLSRLDEGTLQGIAQTGNGKYYRATADGRELDSLLAEIDDLQRAQLATRFETTFIERYQIFLALGLAALIISELIPERKAARRPMDIVVGEAQLVES
ncbi:MAG: VWA domain-containing protein [Candidatus Promineifilaceae bacterium]|nr:VWA domain-containing protein [Candidatus Promineifilaceae bacterium]